METPATTLRRARFGGTALPSLLALLFGLITARAELQFDVFVGYGMGSGDGAIAESSWFPVTIEVYNDGPSFTGKIELAGGQAGQSSTVVVELPTGTRKRILVPLYASGRYVSIEARLRDGRGKVVAAHSQLRPRLATDRESPLIGSLARTLGGSVTIPDRPAKVNNQLQAGVARMSVELFPDNPIALEGLSVLYLHSSKATELKANQVTALLAWLHNGGHLILATEQPSDINATPWLRSILPCEISGIANRPDGGLLQAWLDTDTRKPAPGQATSDPRTSRTAPRRVPPSRAGTNGAAPANPPTAAVPVQEKSVAANPFSSLEHDAAFQQANMPVAVATLRDGEVRIGSAANPLVIRCARGRGTMTVLLFSPELEPFRSWASKSWFWARIADVPIEFLAGWNHTRVSGNAVDGVFGAMIDSKQIRKLPIGWLFVLLLAYLAVIGPVDQYVLKKINKQMLTWITFPLYVVFFSVLIYYIGYRLRAGETEWNEFHVVDVMPRGERADLRGRSYGSVYSPQNAQYPVASELPFATLRGERDLYGTEVSKAVVEQHGNTFKARLSAPIWTSQLFLSDWWKQDAAPIKLTVKSDYINKYEVTVENLTGRTIPQALLIVGGRVHELGELPRNKTFTVTRGAGQLLRNFVQNQTGNFQVAINQRRSQFGGGTAMPITNHFTAASAASFVSVAEPQETDTWQQNWYGAVVSSREFDLAESAERGDILLLAWMPGHTLVPPINKFSPRRSSKDTLLRVIVQSPTSKAP